MVTMTTTKFLALQYLLNGLKQYATLINNTKLMVVYIYTHLVMSITDIQTINTAFKTKHLDITTNTANFKVLALNRR